MRKMLVVAMREYQAAVKTKAFIISLVLMPVLMGGGIAFQTVMQDKVDTADKRVAVLDYSGQVYDAVEKAAAERNAKDIFKEEGEQRKQDKPRFIIEKVEPTSDDIDQVKLALSDRVRDKEIFAFIVIPKDVVDPKDEKNRPVVQYHSNSPTYDDFERWVYGPINSRIRELRFQAAHLDAELVGRLNKSTYVRSFDLTSVDESGNIVEAKATNKLANIFVPMGMMMLMFMVVMVGASPLMQSVLEEKMQRIAEVLLGSIPPFQLMMGKLIGVVGVSLTLASLYLIGAFVVVHYSGFGAMFPSAQVIWFVVFLILAVLLFGSLFIAIGAAVSDLKEAQSLMTPVMLLVVFPMFVWLKVVQEPSAPLSIILSLIPPATPMLMTLRQAVPPGVPIWQPLLGIALVLLTTLFCVFAAGRIFRVGILMQGKGASLGQMMRWIVRG